MKKTYAQQILSYLLIKELKNQNAVFNKNNAEKKFKNVYNVHNTVMRAARKLAENGLLSRVSPGVYKLTKLGRKFVNQ